MSDKVLYRCPHCDFKVTQAMAEDWAEELAVKHLLKRHEKEALELIRKAREKEVEG